MAIGSVADDELVYANHQNENNDYEYDTENDTDELSSDDEYYKQSDIYIGQDDDNKSPATEFSLLKIGITTLVVSSHGRIRKIDDFFSSSLGFALPGTPYRTFPIEVSKNQIEEYYVHDLVWRAFNGEPPDGWEVRHNFWEAKNAKEFYSNSLENLDIYPSSVTHLSRYARNTLPEYCSYS